MSLVGTTLTFKVAEVDRDERLDRFLAARTLYLSRARIKVLIDQGLARVENTGAKAARRLKPGETITLLVPEPEPVELTPDAGVAFEILYQDPDIIIVNKPPGLVVHPAAGHQTGTLVHGLLAACPDLAGIGGEIRPGVVHRLDKDTSGVMVAAKNEQAHRVLVEAFKARKVQKTYLALCRGGPGTETGEIDAPIGRHPLRRKQMSVRAVTSRAALTRFEVVQRFSLGISLLRLHLLTGRTHQIRVHLASIGCPVLGDRIYGTGLGGLKDGGGPLKGLIKRQMLHAHELNLSHPRTGREMKFMAPLPQDMEQVISALEAMKSGSS
ncbi:MAG: RluA family pseudouridine synthase [Pseudomonadota bacterium]